MSINYSTPTTRAPTPVRAAASPTNLAAAFVVACGGLLLVLDAALSELLNASVLDLAAAEESPALELAAGFPVVLVVVAAGAEVGVVS